MSGIKSYIDSESANKLSHSVFFEKKISTEKGFFGNKTVIRLHLATKNADGETVLLDEKGVKESRGFFSKLFGSSLRIQNANKTLNYKVNTTSLKHFLTRLEGKKVLWIREKAPLLLGTRILAATNSLFKNETREKVKSLVRDYLPQTATLNEDREKKAAILEQEIDTLSQRIASLEKDLAEYHDSSGQFQLKDLTNERREKVESLRALSSSTPSSIASTSSLSQLEGYGIHGPSTSLSNDLLNGVTSNVQVSWDIEEVAEFSRPQTPDELNLQVQRSTRQDDWWMNEVERSLGQLRLNPQANEKQIAHYEALLAKHKNT